MKSYTDIEQSRKLAEILSLESADGFWEYHDKLCSEGDEWEGYEDYPRAEPYLEYTRKENEWKEDKSDVPCWSLAALLDLIPEYIKFNEHTWKFSLDHCGMFYMDADTYDTNTFSSYIGILIDDAYEIILKLKEKNLL